MWHKDTLREAEATLDHWFAELYSGGAEPDRDARDTVRKDIRRILHQLAYDAVSYLNPRLVASGNWIQGELGIDLDLIDRGPGKAQQELTTWEPYDDPRD